MKHVHEIVSLFLLAAACGDNASMTETGTPTSAPSTHNPVTTNEPPTSETEDGTGTTAGSTDATSTPPTTGTSSVEGGPMFLSFGANVATLTQDESVTFSAVLTDPDGVADIVGGTLRSADESLEFGVFVAAGQPGTYSISLSWAQIHQSEPIEFEAGELPRSFRAVFFDQGGHKAIDDLMVDLVCADGGACDGTCTDLSSDELNCGQCGHACDGGGEACESATCAPAWSACVNFDEGLDNCAAVCQSVGESCVANGCPGNSTALFFDIPAECDALEGPSYGSMPCDELQQWAPGAMTIRCCCTDTK